MVLLQAVKTQMKCSIMLHFIRVYTVCEGKNIFRQKYTIFFENYNLSPLDMYHGLSPVYLSNQKEKSISIQLQMPCQPMTSRCRFNFLISLFTKSDETLTIYKGYDLIILTKSGSRFIITSLLSSFGSLVNCEARLAASFARI